MVGPVGLVYSLQYGVINPDKPQSLQLTVASNAIEARTRKLQAGWTVEAQHDMKDQHGLDLEAELTGALASEITYEVYNEIINDLVALSQKTTFSFPLTEPYVGDRMCRLMLQINVEANAIARDTRRGAGNIIVTSPMVVSMLQTMRMPGLTFKPANSPSTNHGDGLTHFGDIAGSVNGVEYVMYKVFVSLAPSLNETGKDKILILYKGGSGETDTGYIYGPYIPVMSSGITLNPITFEPVMHLLTRYGKHVNKEEGLSNSHNYYRTIEIDALTLLTGTEFTTD
jgi:hypothetical protein